MSTAQGTGRKEPEASELHVAPASGTRPTRAADAPPVLEIHDMTVAYHRRPVLWDIDLTIEGSSLVGVLGPNGAGKSTLIKAVLGLVPLAGGSVKLFGRDARGQHRLVGYVPQRESVDWEFPVSVLDVVLMGTYGRLGWFRRPGRAEREWALECLRHVGLADFARRQIGQLSGGQQQRTFLARALAQRAEVYFMDEPMAGVDAATERVIFSLLTELREAGKTVLAVHHDLRTVPAYFDQVVLLNMRLVASGATERVFTNENLRKTYGGRLGVLETAGQALAEQRRSV